MLNFNKYLLLHKSISFYWAVIQRTVGKLFDLQILRIQSRIPDVFRRGPITVPNEVMIMANGCRLGTDLNLFIPESAIVPNKCVITEGQSQSFVV